MKNIGFFINNTNNKKNLDINFHNLKVLHNNFDEIFICDENNEYSMQLEKKIKNFRNIKKYVHSEKFNIFQKIDVLIKNIERKDNIDALTIILDDYIYINGLNQYFDFVNKCSYDIISFTDSSELFYHLQINIFSVKKNIIQSFCKLIEEYSVKNQNDYNLKYLEFLKEITKIENKTAYCKTAYIESVEKKNIYLSNCEYYYYLLSREILPIIKIKLLETIIRDFDNKDVVHKKIPIDFDIDVYRSYEDLLNFDDEFLKKHFLEYGQFECRKYKKNELILPEIIWNKLNKIKLVKYFDFPENFDFYSYKNKNDDLKKLNKIELKKHWINYGAFEDRKY